VSRAPCHVKLHSLHRLRAPTIAILAADPLVKETVRLASSVGKKATGPETAPSHPRPIPMLIWGEAILLRLAQVRVSSAVRLDTGQETALHKISVLVPVLEIERLHALSALLFLTSTELLYGTA